MSYLRLAALAVLAPLLLVGCSSREEKICKKMAVLMGATGASPSKMARCIKRAKRARKMMPKRFECRARCIESSINRKAFYACNDKCDPLAAARRAAMRAARHGGHGAGTGRARVLAVPREVRRKWFTECMAKCQHFIKDNASQKDRIEGTRKAGLCSRDCVRAKISAYKKSGGSKQAPPAKAPPAKAPPAKAPPAKAPAK